MLFRSDSKVTTSQLKSMMDYIGGEPNLLLIQCSGANWFPFVYTQYDSVAKMMSNMMYERRFYPLLTQVIVGFLVCDLQENAQWR